MSTNFEKIKKECPLKETMTRIIKGQKKVEQRCLHIAGAGDCKQKE